MTIIMRHDFEHYCSREDWEPGYFPLERDEIGVGNLCSFSSVKPHHGSVCCKSYCAAGASGSGNRAYLRYDLSIFNPMNYRAYIRFEDLPTGADNRTGFIHYGDGGGASAACYFAVIYTGGVYKWVIRYRDAGAFFNQLGTEVVDTKKTYCLETELYTNAGGTGYARLWVDGKLNVEKTAIASDRSFLSVCVGQFQGTAHSVTGTSVYMDCIVAATNHIGCESPLWTSSCRRRLRMKRGGSGQIGKLHLK